MGTTTVTDPAPDERDFYLWTQRQAAELRRAAAQGSDLPLDWQNLAEEIESSGERDRRELYSRLVRAIEHLLKLQFAPVEEPKRLWRLSVTNQRSDLKAISRSSPSFRREAGRFVPEAYEEVRGIVERAIPDLELGAWPDLPRRCPYALDQILDPDFRPEPGSR
jgi:hypothetical protein